MVLLLIIATLVAAMLRSGPASDSAAALLETGERATAPALPTGSIDGSGSTVTIPGYDPAAATPYGQITVVNFWASWCAPCREEMPYLTGLAETYADRDVVVVGINIDDQPEDALAFAEEFEVDYPLVLAEDGARRAWGLRGQPETFVVDADGTVASHVPGPVDDGTLRPVLDQLLAG